MNLEKGLYAKKKEDFSLRKVKVEKWLWVRELSLEYVFSLELWRTRASESWGAIKLANIASNIPRILTGWAGGGVAAGEKSPRCYLLGQCSTIRGYHVASLSEPDRQRGQVFNLIPERRYDLRSTVWRVECSKLVEVLKRAVEKWSQ